MIEFLKRLFGQSAPSSSTAKERLRLVLMTDHLELAPEMIDAMKRDLVDVISRYVEVDRDKIDVTFEQQDRALAMLANIPILSVNRRPNGEIVALETPAAALETPAAVLETPAAPQELPIDTPAVAVVPDGPKRRRRRRKKAKTAAAASPEPAVLG